MADRLLPIELTRGFLRSFSASNTSDGFVGTPLARKSLVLLKISKKMY